MKPWFFRRIFRKALINNAHELRIIHGVGNGTLKKKVHAKFKEYKDIKKYWHPEEQLGGEGVTYVSFCKMNKLTVIDTADGGRTLHLNFSM